MKGGCTTSFIELALKAIPLISTGLHHRRRTDPDAARVPPGQHVVNDLPGAVGRSHAERASPSSGLSGLGGVGLRTPYFPALPGFGNRPTTLLKWILSFIGWGRIERELSVMHTGDDLSLPDQM
jgi:hypothetical protein